VEGLLKSIKFSAKFTILNLCGDKLVSVMDIIKVSKKILNINNNVLIKESHASKPSIKSTSNKKIKKLFNWTPKIKYEEFLLKNYK
jgi:UDP-glucose 4-epimerase